ncbi:MAG: extracellular solute-binding protein [Deinococcota bacterium]
MKRLLIVVSVLVLSGLASSQTDINVWIAFTDYRLDWTRERAEEFNAQFSDYNVVVSGYASYNEAFDATVLAAEQGNPPAVTHFFEAATQNARDAVNDGEPLFKSVSEALAGRTEVNGIPVVLDDVVSAASDYYTLDGIFTSMPWNTSTSVMFSNADMLERAGIESIPETWAEIDAACATILAMDGAPDNCITWPNHGWFFEQSIAQQGADLANNGNGREERATEVFYNSEAALAYTNWWKSLADSGYYIYTGRQRDWGGTQNAFESQQVAFLIFSSSDSTVIPANTAENFTTVVSRMPYNQDAGYNGNIIGGATLWLNNGLSADAEEGALAFLNWLNNPANAASWHQATGYIPITNTSFNTLTDEGWFSDNPNAAVANNQLDIVPTTGAIFGGFVAIRDVYTEAMEDILLNDADVAATLDGVNADANTLLEEYNFLFAPN